MSNTARPAHRTGALLSMFSLPAAAMGNHLKLAAKSPEASIEKIEIDGFEGSSFRVVPNPRSPMSRAEVLAYEALALDIPDTLNYGTPFVNGDVERETYDETESFLDLCYSVLIQAWIVTCKCMTAPDQPPVSVEKRMAKYQQQGRINPKYILQPEARRLIQNAIRQAMVVRQFLAFELQLARSQSLLANRYYAMVGDIGKYIENSGMGGFFLTLKFGLGTRWPTLALAAFSGELQKLKALMLHYQALGDGARYMALLESPKMMDFAPAEYPLIFSYAMGIGTVIDANMRNYAYGRPYLNPQYFQLGVETARRQQGAVDNQTAADLGMTKEEKSALADTLAKLNLGKRAGDRQPVIDPFASDVPVAGATSIPPVQPSYYMAPPLDEESDEEDQTIPFPLSAQAIAQYYGEPSAGPGSAAVPDSRTQSGPTLPTRQPGMSEADYARAMNQYVRDITGHYSAPAEPTGDTSAPPQESDGAGLVDLDS